MTAIPWGNIEAVTNGYILYIYLKNVLALQSFSYTECDSVSEQHCGNFERRIHFII